MTGPLAIRADGGEGIGAGHVMRCLALADAWQARGGEVTWFTAQLPPGLRDAVAARGAAIHDVAAGDAWEALARWGTARSAGWVVVDGYDFQSGPSLLRAAGLRVAVIDDDGRWGAYDCDLLVNQNLHAREVPYAAGGATLLLGHRYIMLRREFLRQPRRPIVMRPVTRVLISFGGDDACGRGHRLATLLQPLHPEWEIVLTTGFTDNSSAASAATARLRRHTGSDLSALMAQTDVAVVAAGSICWELAYLGVPMVTTIVAGNQTGVAAGLAAAGAAVSLGWFDDLEAARIVAAVDDLVADAERRAAMSRAAQALVDGHGAARVVDAMYRFTAAPSPVPLS